MSTKATRKELGDLGVVYARLFEFVKNGKRPAATVIAGMQRLADGQFPEGMKFDRYGPLLLSLDEQLARLREYNQKYWDNHFTQAQLADVETSFDFIQRVDDLAVFHVQFDSLEETVDMWWRVFVGEQIGYWCSPELKVDAEHLRLLASDVLEYKPGIHLIMINLVAHWEPEIGRTLEDVREGAKSGGKTLAQLEIFSAYGLHPELFREQDGKNFPFSDLPGTDVSVLGKPGLGIHSLSLFWNLGSLEAQLSAGSVKNNENEWAAPLITGRWY